jgi:hypothetical protein
VLGQGFPADRFARAPVEPGGGALGVGTGLPLDLGSKVP